MGRLVALLGRAKMNIHGLEGLSLDDRLRAESFVFDGPGCDTGTGCASANTETQRQAAGTQAAKQKPGRPAEVARKRQRATNSDQDTNKASPSSRMVRGRQALPLVATEVSEVSPEEQDE